MATKALKTRRKCELCGYEFTARRRYCSGLCAQRAYHARRRSKGGQHAAAVGDSTRDNLGEYHYGPHGNPDRDEDPGDSRTSTVSYKRPLMAWIRAGRSNQKHSPPRK